MTSKVRYEMWYKQNMCEILQKPVNNVIWYIKYIYIYILLVAGLADTEFLPELARKKRRLGLGTAALEPKTPRAILTIEMQQLQPVPTFFLDNSEVPASSSDALVVSPLLPLAKFSNATKLEPPNGR